jgi:hypothetical protein
LVAFATWDYKDGFGYASGYPEAEAEITYGGEYTGNNSRGFSDTLGSVYVNPRVYGGVTSATQTLGSNSNPATTQQELTTNQIYYLELKAATDGTVPGSQAIAIADPSISFDPNAYPMDTLLLSPGIQNEVNSPAAVPQPASVWMLLSGICVISGFAKRKLAPSYERWQLLLRLER